MRTLNGRHVLGMFAFGFGTIIAVNLTLAIHAVRSFPGLEVKNAYIASQQFQAERAAQKALGWQVSAAVEDAQLRLSFAQAGKPVAPKIEQAVFGRPTTVADDQRPVFVERGGIFVAPVIAGPGNWNLRIVARADDGTRFRRRIVVAVAP